MKAFVIVLLGILACGCAQAESRSSRIEIEHAISTFQAAHINKSTELLKSVVDEEITIISYNGEASISSVMPREVYLESVDLFFAENDVVEVTIEPRSINALGDVAIVVGTFRRSYSNGDSNISEISEIEMRLARSDPKAQWAIYKIVFKDIQREQT